MKMTNINDFFKNRLNKLKNRKKEPILNEVEQQPKEENKEIYLNVVISNYYDLDEKIDICKGLSAKIGNGVCFEEDDIKVCIDTHTDKEEMMGGIYKLKKMIEAKKYYDELISSLERSESEQQFRFNKAQMAFEMAKVLIMSENDRDNFMKKPNDQIVNESVQMVNKIFDKFDVDNKNDSSLQQTIEMLKSINDKNNPSWL